MFTKSAIALAFVIVSVSGALAAGKPKQHSPNPNWDVYSSGVYLGSDPDPHVRTRIWFDSERN
jgi:hypothetical protein